MTPVSRDTTRDGFALVEVMMAAAILAALVMAGLSLGDYLATTSKYSDRRNGLTALESMIASQINDSDLCAVAMLGNTIPNVQDTQVKVAVPHIGSDAPDGVTIAKDISVRGLRVKLTSLALRNQRLLSGTTYFGNLYLAAQDDSGVVYHDDFVAGLIYTLDGSNAISSCHGNSMINSATVCGDMGCTYTKGGNPPCACPGAAAQPCANKWEYSTAYAEDGTPSCHTLTEKKATCDPGSYVTGVSIASGVSCVALPPPTTTTTLPPCTYNLIQLASVTTGENDHTSATPTAYHYLKGSDQPRSFMSISNGTHLTKVRFRVVGPDSAVVYVIAVKDSNGVHTSVGSTTGMTPACNNTRPNAGFVSVFSPVNVDATVTDVALWVRANNSSPTTVVVEAEQATGSCPDSGNAYGGSVQTCADGPGSFHAWWGYPDGF